MSNRETMGNSHNTYILENFRGENKTAFIININFLSKLGGIINFFYIPKGYFNFL